MNTKKLSIIVLTAVAASAMAFQGSAAQKLAPIYNKLDALSMKKDEAGLSKLLSSISTKDCVFINGKGVKQTPAEVIAQMKQQMAFVTKFTKSTSHIDKVSPKGKDLVATVSSSYSIVIKAPGDEKTHKVEGQSRSEDTWVKVGSDWKLKVSKTISESTKMDGKTMPGM